MNKKIIQRNLDLSLTYVLTDKKYIPLIDGIGLCCDNCGKLIANIATVKSTKGTFSIGFDCLETVLINNKLLEGKSVEKYQHYKTHLPLYIKRAKEISESVKQTNERNQMKVSSILLDITDFLKWKREGLSYMTFYYVFENGKRYNSNFKIKGSSDLQDLVKTMETICKIKIQTQ